MTWTGESSPGLTASSVMSYVRALQDLANFTPFPDEWSVEDKVLFEQAFQFHGKSFHRIRQMLPDKSIAALVKYYYRSVQTLVTSSRSSQDSHFSWKKTRTRTSLMDRQAKKLTSVREDGTYGEESYPEPASDEEEKEVTSHTIVIGQSVAIMYNLGV